MPKTLQLRRDSAADWTSNNPTLSEGEIGYETDTGKVKIGDGSTVWNSLDYLDSAIDHDQLTNFASNEHFLQTAITNVSTALSTGLLKVTTGTGALSVITDNSSNWDTAYEWGDHAGLYDTIGTAAGLVGTHESTYNHTNYNTAYSHSQLTSGNPHSVTPAELSLVIGTDVQAHGDILDDLNTLGVNSSDGEFIVGTGAGALAWESGNTARTSLGLGTGNTVEFANLTLTDYFFVNGNSTVFGYQAGNNDNGFGSVLLGRRAGYNLKDSTTNYCVFIGWSAGSGNTEDGVEGNYNIGIGYSSGQNLTTGSYNCLIGSRQTGLELTTGNRNIFIGAFSGCNQTTNNNRLIIDSQDRGSAANEVTKALLYGIVDADEANQILRVNAKLGINANPQEDVHAADTVRADTAFNLNGTDGVSGTFVDNNENTVTVSGGIITDLGV